MNLELKDRCIHRTICSGKSTTSEALAVVIEKKTVNSQRNLFRKRRSQFLINFRCMNPFLHFWLSHEPLGFSQYTFTGGRDDLRVTI
jgi:hypothetical protein